jgi:hypothetical protein
MFMHFFMIILKMSVGIKDVYYRTPAFLQTPYGSTRSVRLRIIATSESVLVANQQVMQIEPFFYIKLVRLKYSSVK